MIHVGIGKLGELFVIIAFCFALASIVSYLIRTQTGDKWVTKSFARSMFIIHGLATIGVVATLFFIINQHYFEYHYAFSHSSRLLPVYYQISCFWEGQEGSFLLWIFWNVILGFIILKTNKFWEAPVMTIFSGVQLFLLSMILGIAPFEWLKIGSSPFILLRDAIAAPIFNTNPNFIPEDGSGLNILLQNYWMVIHPPTLFLGFATTLVPFAYCLAGLWVGKYRGWVRPALPWTIFSSLILGVGILMGAYWAYETLNFGGYWNWDPVENAVYVPWLVQIAALHTMISFKTSNTALKSAIILVLSVFLLILYSTFLTRSGILGNSSVHSFTDLGLSGQLLIYLLTFVVVTIFVCWKAWKNLKSDNDEPSVYSREFWIFLGTIVLTLMAFQIIIPTSIPVFNAILQNVGIDSNLAPPVDQVEFYSKFQIWFAIALALLSGFGQFFWWKKIDKQKLQETISKPIIVALVISSVIFFLGDLHEPSYMLLLTCSIFTITANLFIAIPLFKSSYKLSGGAITHMGLGIMLIGILYSSGFSKTISLNNTGMVWSRDLPEEINQKNLLIFLNEPRQMGEYEINYLGKRRRIRETNAYVKDELLQPTLSPVRKIVKREINSLNLKKGDTVTLIDAGKTYFEVSIKHKDGQNFKIYPVVQTDESKEMVVYSPDIRHTLKSDLYAHVRTFPDPDEKEQWKHSDTLETQVGAQFFINDFVATLESINRIFSIDDIELSNEDVAVKASISVLGPAGTVLLEPIFLIKNKMVGRIPDESLEIASKVTLLNILPETNTFELSIETTQKDWIIIEALEKPLINLLWVGTIIMIFGFIMALYRRYSNFIKMRDKGIE